jgi:hypothetical protein
MRPSWTSEAAPRYSNYESTSNINYTVPQRIGPPSYNLHEEAAAAPWHRMPMRDYSHSSYSDVVLSAQSQHLFATIDSREHTSNIQDYNVDVLHNISYDAKTNDEERPKAKMVFPCVLYQMLQDADDKGHEAIVSWVSQGRAFRVHNTKKFVCSILPKYFAQTKFTSFQRQLNMYCFVRITTGRHKGAYYHHHFVRGEPQLCDKIVRMPFKGKKGKTGSTLESDPNFHDSDAVEASMAQRDSVHSIINSNTSMVQSDQAKWHDPQQLHYYKDAKTVYSRYAWGTQSDTGDHMETSMLSQKFSHQTVYGNGKMEYEEPVALHKSQQPVQYHNAKVEDSKYAWGSHPMDSMDSMDASTMIRRPKSSIIHSYTKSNSGHLTMQEGLHPVQYHGAKLIEAKYARGKGCMEPAMKAQESINSTSFSNADLDKSWHKSVQDPLLSVQYHDVKTADSIYAWNTPFTGIVSQLQRMNDRNRSTLPKMHYNRSKGTNPPTPNQSLSYSLSKEDEVSSFCSADW